jgi:flagellar biosynthetic protein FlhB
MAEDDKEQKTEEATDKRRDDTFKKGRTAQSKEIGSTFVLLASLWMLYAFGGMMRANMSEMMVKSFALSSHYQLTDETIKPLAFYYLKETLIILGPIMLAIVIFAVFSTILQNGGIILSLDPLMPNFSKLNPISGFARFVNMSALAELFKSILKIIIVGSICYMVIKGEWSKIPLLADKGVEEIVQFTARIALKLIFYVFLLLVALAAADFGFQRYSFAESIKMTKQEIRDENKESEGDPMTKQRIRSAQYAMARRRMMEEVPRAEVIITNPTHLAVALAYQRDKMAAPKIVAKGAGHVAAKIREIAKANNIPIIEDKPLARLLFKTIDIGGSIPEELYRTIAEILAYVYKLKGKVF